VINHVKAQGSKMLGKGILEFQTGMVCG